jgi:NADPH:quinone reductase-like Zn-dependent oxidoreductase
MRAAVYRKYGPPEVVQIEEVPKPVPLNDEILVKVHFASVNRTDTGFRSAEYIISRFWSGLWKPKFPVLGCEFSGVVEAIGNDVYDFQVGDAVFGFNDKQFGGHGEYLTIAASAAVARIPEKVTLDQAAALTEGAHYALVDIRAAKVQANHHVMVYGASGAIGSAAVQILGAMGVHVTAVCNTQNVALMRSLGAHNVIDYQTEDYTHCQQYFDFILDAVGKSSYKICKPLLSAKGIYISTELGKNGVNIFWALAGIFSKGKKVLFPIPQITKEDVEYLGDLAQQGLLKPVIDRFYNLDEIVEAHRYAQSGQKTGNVLIKMHS